MGPDISFDEDEDVADVDTVCTIKTVSLQLDPTDPGTMAKESAKDPASYCQCNVFHTRRLAT